MRRERGVALITVLLVVALATVAAVDMSSRGAFDVRRTSNRLALEQAHDVALGGERWAVAVLARDRRGHAEDWKKKFIAKSQGHNVDVDSRDETWAKKLPPLPIEGGQVAGVITDAQGRFNVNDLVDAQGKVDPVAVARFKRLLQALGLDPKLSQAVVDWIDPDSQTTYPAGAENDYYASLDHPYRAANRPLVVASELRLVRGIDAEAWRRLAPHVTALPQRTAINVNTADPFVLQAVIPQLDAESAQSLYEQLGDSPYNSVDEVLKDPRMQDAKVDGTGLSVRSDFFRVRVDVSLGPIDYTLYSWLQRSDNGACRVLRRARTPD